MIKYLYETCQGNFHVKNKHNENAINICITNCKKDIMVNYFECLVYLVEKVKVDVKYMYEESLLMAENSIIIKFLEKKLAEVGINITKKEIEGMNMIKSQPPLKTDLDIDLDRLPHNEFNIRDYLSDETTSFIQDSTLIFSILGDQNNA